MQNFSLYRKRLIPNECILLKDDHFISFDKNRLVTSWKTLHPKKDLDHGISCFFLDDGLKVSKFYANDGTLLYWYIDIISHEWKDDYTSLYITDLLADVLIYPDGFVKVVDIGELSDALSKGLITQNQLTDSLYKLDKLLNCIYNHSFEEKMDYVSSFEK